MKQARLPRLLACWTCIQRSKNNQTAPIQSSTKKQIAKVETMCHLQKRCQASLLLLPNCSVTLYYTPRGLSGTVNSIPFRPRSSPRSLRHSWTRDKLEHAKSTLKSEPHVSGVVEIDARSAGHPEASIYENHRLPDAPCM